jgi:Conjugative transposon protein TraO
MKKIIIILAILPNLIFAQTHLKNQKFIDFSLGGYDGFSTKNYSFHIGLGKYDKKDNVNCFEFSYARKLAYIENNDIQIPVEQIFVAYKRDFNLLKNYNNTIIFSLFAKTNVGYEFINRNKNIGQDYVLANKSDYLMGIGFGPNLEFNNFHIGVANNINFISQYQKFSVFPYLKYRFHL